MKFVPLPFKLSYGKYHKAISQTIVEWTHTISNNTIPAYCQKIINQSTPLVDDFHQTVRWPVPKIPLVMLKYRVTYE